MTLSFKTRTHQFSKVLAILFSIAIVSISVVAINAQKADAAADTCTWSGLGADNLWTTSSNWTGCDGLGTPEDGDVVSFPAGAPRLSPVNDFAGLNLNRVSIAGDNYTITGNSIQTTPISDEAILIEGTDNNFGITTTINATSSKNILTHNTNTISGDIILNITGAGSDFSIGTLDSLSIDGEISGSVERDFGLNNVNIDGTVAYNGSSSFTVGRDMLLFTDTNVQCGGNNCFGDANNAITIYSTGDLTFTGATSLANPITITGAGDASQIIQDADGMVNLNGNITADASFEFLIEGPLTFWINGNIDIAEDVTISFIGFMGNSNEIFGIVSGEGNLLSAGSLTLNGDNTYTGTTTVTEIDGGSYGQIYVTHHNGLGSTDGGTIIENSGKIVFASPYGSIEVAEPIIFANDGIGSSPSIEISPANNIRLSGTITLDGNGYIYADNGQPGTITISGKITGEGDLRYESFGINPSFNVNGTETNDYIGTTTVSNASVIGGKTGGAIAIPGDLVIESPNIASSFYVRENHQIADTATVTIDGADSSFNINFGRSESVAMVEGDGTLSLVSDTSLLNVGFGNANGTFSGTITSEEGTIEKSGTGTWEITGTNVVSSGGWVNYELSEGIVGANFSDDSAQNSTFNVDGGTLRGTSTIGPVNMVSGIIAPGNSAGCMNTGPITMSSLVEVQIEIGGETQCTEYDNLTSSGAVALADATLSLFELNSYVPTLGTEFEIINGTSVTGQFAGLSNGDVITVDSVYYQINYTSDSVTLTAVSAPSPTTTTTTTTSPSSPTTVIAPGGTSGSLPATGVAIISTVFVALLLIGAGLTLRRKRVITVGNS